MLSLETPKLENELFFAQNQTFIGLYQCDFLKKSKITFLSRSALLIKVKCVLRLVEDEMITYILNLQLQVHCLKLGVNKVWVEPAVQHATIFFDKSKLKNHFKQVVIMFWLKIIVQSQRHGAPHQPITRLEIFRSCTTEHIIWVISYGLYNMAQYYLNSMVPWNKGLLKIIEIELSSSKFSSCPWT